MALGSAAWGCGPGSTGSVVDTDRADGATEMDQGGSEAGSSSAADSGHASPVDGATEAPLPGATDSGLSPANDPADGEYGIRARLPAPNSEMAVTAVGDFVYVLGGYPATRITQSTLQIYDVVSNT